MNPYGAFICNNICKYTPRRDSVRCVNDLFAVPQEHIVRPACQSCLIGPIKVDHDLHPWNIIPLYRLFFTGILRPHRTWLTHVRNRISKAITKRREASIVELRLCKSAITKTIRFSATFSANCTVEREMTVQ